MKCSRAFSSSFCRKKSDSSAPAHPMHRTHTRVHGSLNVILRVGGCDAEWLGQQLANGHTRHIAAVRGLQPRRPELVPFILNGFEQS